MTCSLKEALKHQLNVTDFKQGCTFYEFVHKVENITDDKEIIFMHKVVILLYSLLLDSYITGFKITYYLLLC